MNMKYALLALLAFGFAFAGLSISDFSVSPESIEPGGSGYITLTISNPSTTDTVDLVTVRVSSTESLGANREFSVGDLEQSSSTVLTVPFRSSETIQSGIYSLEVRARGTVDTFVYNEVTGSFRTTSEVVEKISTIPVKVVREPILSISLSSENLEDMTAETIAISNSGGKATNLRISIANEGIGFLNRDELYFGTVEASSSQPITIDARGASDGATKLSIQLTYLNELGEEITETKEIPITVKKAAGDFTFAQQAPVTTGREETLTLAVTNSGDPVQDLQLTFASGSGVVLRGMNRVEFGNLAAGESRTATIPLVANLQPGTNNVNVSLSWVERGENREGTITIPLSVKSDSEVGVYLEANPTPLVSGGEHTLSVTVSNLGSYAIQGTTVELSSDAFQLLTVQPEQYIGGLEEDDFSSVQYKIRVKDIAPGTYDASVLVRYKDASGAQIAETKPLQISIAGPPQQGNGTTALLALGIIVVAAGYWYFRMRKKQKAQG
ncbi:MAG: hypothetical protein AB1657_03210 [Candidatus Micrarchaeota archaeon]